MKRIRSEKQERFAFRKLSQGLVSAAVASFFFVSAVAGAAEVQAQSIRYQYVTEQELTDTEKQRLVRDLPRLAAETDATYYLVYRPTSQPQSASTTKTLPQTGLVDSSLALMAGVTLLILAVKVGKKGKKELAGVILLTATGASLLAPAGSAVTSQLLSKYNHAVEVATGQALPAPMDIEGYTYIGYVKDSRAVDTVSTETENPISQPGQELVTALPENAPSLELPAVDIREEIVVESQVIPFEEETVYSADLLEGVSQISQSGQAGERTIERKNVYVNGQLVQSTAISETISKAPVNQVTTVGTKVVTEILPGSDSRPQLPITEEVISHTESIPFETQEVYDESLPDGTRQVVQPGQAGQKTIDSKNTYIDGVLVKSELVGETITLAPTPQIIHIGTKPITQVPETAPSQEALPAVVLTEDTQVVTEAVAFETQFEYDATLAEGSRQLVQTGQAGVRTIETKNYYADGVLIKSEQVSNAVTTAPVVEVIKIGTKKADVITSETEKRTEEVAFETEYIDTADLYVGEEVVSRQGVAGSKEVTTTYTLINGVRQENPTQTESLVLAPVSKQILRGTKPVEGTETVITTEEVPFQTEYSDDPNLLKGKTQLLQAGVVGSKEITTTYQTIKGVRQENPTITEKIVLEPKVEKIARGTKVEQVPVVTITNLLKNEDAKTVTATYSLSNPTGNFTSAVALLYDGTNLVQQVDITDPNGNLELTGLDYYTDYTLKTRVLYTMDGQANQSDQETILESIREFELLYKKIEIKDIDSVTIYRRKDGSYVGSTSLADLPASTDDLFVKVSSDRFKEIYLPVTNIVADTKDGRDVYKVTTSFAELVEEKDAAYVANRDFYIAKMATDANTYTSFKELVAAMKANQTGTFKLGADLYADEVPVGDVGSYVGNFSGTLIGANDGYNFAIHNLKAPLFLNFYGKVENLDLKNIQLNTSIQPKLAALAHISDSNARVTDVSVEGTIRGKQDVAGLIHTAYNTVFKNVSFKGSIESYGTSATTVGGIVGHGILAAVVDAKVDATITLPGTENQIVGGIAGRMTLQQDVPRSATIQNAHVQGEIKTSETGAIIGSVAGTNQSTVLPNYVGNINNVVNEMVGAPSVVGKPVNMDTRIANTFSTTADTHPKVTLITADQAQEKVAAMTTITTSLDDSGYINFNDYSVDYLTVDKAQASHKTAYLNMEKILPFYNKELLVYYGNKIAVDDKLNTERLLDIVPMKDDLIVSDISGEKAAINKIMLHYADGTIEYKTVSYKEDFKNGHVAEYAIAGMDLIYTPEIFLATRDSLVSEIVSSLSSVTLDSPELKALVGFPTTFDANRQTATAKDFYFSDTFAEVKADLENNVRKLLSSSLNGQDAATEAYFKERITSNKEAFMLGLTYLTRWYAINYGSFNTKDLTIFEPDFFGKEAASALDTILSIGNAGYEALRPYNNVQTYANHLAKQNGQASVFDLVEAYRARFLPNTTDNDWFKQTTKAYIVESKSQVAEAAAKQENAEKHSKYALAVYDKITNPNWAYRQMLLPLLTLPQENIFIISNMNTLAIGSYEHYVNDYSDPVKRDQVRQKVDLAATRQRDNADFWYKILDEENRDKLFRTVLNNEGFKMYGPDGQTSYHNLTANVDAIQDYYGPINKWYAEGATKTAYADGKETYYVTYDMLGDYGTTLYSHEMVHNQDGSTYLHGYGRRIGQGMEVYADGLLQNVSSLDKMILGFNAVFTGDVANRVHVADPASRFTNEADFNEYFHNQFDVLYLLDYLEGMAILEKSDAVKKDWFRKIENYYVQAGGVNTHAGNKARELTDAEVAALQDFDDLIDQSIIDYRQYFGLSGGAKTLTKEWTRNGYHSVPMFAANYSALSNPYGSPGDIMFRRMAFELIAAKGYTEGFIPYASGQLSDYAMSQNSIIYDTWNKKDTGLITDQHVLEQVFKGEYATWEDFKKAMFAERVEKAEAGKLKPFTMQYELGVANSTKEVTVTTYAQLQTLMEEAMEADTNGRIFYSTNNVNLSRVHALKVKVYQALMNTTDDFRTSIFNP